MLFFSPKLPVSNDPRVVFGGGIRFAKLIDFGQSIDMTKYPPNTTFMAKVNTKCFQCIEMKTNRPWTYQVCCDLQHQIQMDEWDFSCAVVLVLNVEDKFLELTVVALLGPYIKKAMVCLWKVNRLSPRSLVCGIMMIS